jgi:2-oxoglutarate ferredoxin oxidoreductase subunit gamma
MLEQILIAGFGGQGVLSMGQLIAQAALEQGLNATWLPSYGPEMRGGTANCIVCFSDDEIGAPLARYYDAVVAMNQPSLEKFESVVRPGGALFINTSIVAIPATRSDIEVFEIAANDIATKATGSDRSANVVALGAMHAVRPLISKSALEAALRTMFGKKSEEVVQMNLKALHAGIEAMAGVATTPSD